jgi:tetraacyldisaccharide 4'-kinase
LNGEPRRASPAGLVSTAFARIAALRRAWYARPGRSRRLSHPVISVGNVSMGGSGKTPVVAALARLLHQRGERPAILTRGYGRRRPTEGVLVVSDGQRVLEPVERSGDEPQWFARTLPGVPVLVGADRYLAGLLAQRHFGTTVSILDDGFQHVQLERDVDLLLVSPDDLNDRVVPAGRLREPLDAAQVADAVLVTGGEDEPMTVATALRHPTAFRVKTRYDVTVAPQRVVAFAGIARPERFFNALRSLGFEVARELTFPDHHWYTARDVDRIHAARREAGATAVITTTKDAVRCTLDCTVLSMTVEIEPVAEFEQWLIGRLWPQGRIATTPVQRSGEVG